MWSGTSPKLLLRVRIWATICSSLTSGNRASRSRWLLSARRGGSGPRSSLFCAGVGSHERVGPAGLRTRKSFECRYVDWSTSSKFGPGRFGRHWVGTDRVFCRYLAECGQQFGNFDQTWTLWARNRRPSLGRIRPRPTKFEPESAKSGQVDQSCPGSTKLGMTSTKLGRPWAKIGTETANIGPRSTKCGQETTKIGPELTKIGPRSTKFDPASMSTKIGAESLEFADTHYPGPCVERFGASSRRPRPHVERRLRSDCAAGLRRRRRVRAQEPRGECEPRPGVPRRAPGRHGRRRRLRRHLGRRRLRGPLRNVGQLSFRKDARRNSGDAGRCSRDSGLCRHCRVWAGTGPRLVEIGPTPQLNSGAPTSPDLGRIWRDCDQSWTIPVPTRPISAAVSSSLGSTSAKCWPTSTNTDDNPPASGKFGQTLAEIRPHSADSERILGRCWPRLGRTSANFRPNSKNCARHPTTVWAMCTGFWSNSDRPVDFEVGSIPREA